MRGVEVLDAGINGMQTTPWGHKNVEIFAACNSTAGYRSPLLGSFRQIRRSRCSHLA